MEEVNQKNFVLKKEIFEKIKTLLTVDQKRYVEINGYKGVAEKGIDVFLKTFFWNLVILGLFFLYLINFEGVKFYDQLAEDKKFYTILFIILTIILIAGLFSLVSSTIYQIFMSRGFDAAKIKTTLDFLLENKRNLTREEYIELYKTFEANNLFKTSIVIVLMLSVRNHIRMENVKNVEERQKKIMLEEEKREESFKKKVLLAKTWCEED